MRKYGCVLDDELREVLQDREHLKKGTFIKKLYYPVFKRTVDIICSLVCLLVLCLILPFVALAIKIDSPGPVFFSQKRVGQYGYLFKIYKLRTMRQDAEKLVDKRVFKNKNNPFVQKENDPRVTRVGRILRKYSIDELPQLFCVLSGKMSFIGPRPFIPPEVEQLRRKHLMRLMVKPGLTGLAQISGRGRLTLKERMEKDLEYIERMSPWLDIKILLRTLLILIRHDGAQ